MMPIGRLTCAYKVTGSETMRLASSKLLGSVGTNLQNPTDTLMRCVIPEDGNLFVQPDQGGAEALVVAMECRPGRFRALFDNNIKPHSYMALQLFLDRFRGTFPVSRYKNVDPIILASYPEFPQLMKTIKNSAQEYDLGKRTIHSKNYKTGWRTFQLLVLVLSEGAIRLSAAEAKLFLTTHEEAFPEIVEQQQEVINRARRDGILRNLFGYPRQFTRLWSDEVDRQAIAFIPQSTVGTITNIAYTELFHRIRKEKLPWFLRNNKHDSLLIECPESFKDQAIAYSKEHIGRELTSTRGETYRMKCGISVGYNWGKYDKDTNPQGMKEL